MCLILFAYRRSADFPLILIANRDEYYARPSRDAHWWDDAEIFAGRDLEAGGTWLGVNRRGRFAAVTNVRETGGLPPGRRSRGELTRDFLAGSKTAEIYLAEVASRAQEYSGFNLLLGDADALWFYSNRDDGPRRIDPGVYGISNGRFDEPWPKLSSGKAELEALLDEPPSAERLMSILTDHNIAADHDLPQTGVSLQFERLLSSRFIRSPDYGTRACSLLVYNGTSRIEFIEQNYIDSEHAGLCVQQTFEILPP